MKKNILFSIFIFILTINTTVLAQWNPQTISTGNLYGIFFITPLDGYIAAQGSIYRTNDGGNTWSSITFTGPSAILMTNSTYLSIYFLSPSTGFAAGFCAANQKRIIIETTDGGATWSIVENNGSTGFIILRKITFTTATNGFAVGENCSLRSTNGGTTWVNMTVPYTASPEYRDIEFPDLNTGFILGDGENFKTINGGNTWTPDTNLTGAFNTIHFYNGNSGYAAGSAGKVFKTTDAGVTWNSLNTHLSETINACRVINNDTAYFGGDGIIELTRSGGTYWETQPYGSTLNINAMFFISQDTGFAVCDNGVVLKTTNAGGISAPVAAFTFNPLVCPDSSISFFNNSLPQGCTYSWFVNSSLFSNSYDANYIFTNANQTDTISLVVSNGTFQDSVAAFVNVEDSLDFAFTSTQDLDTTCYTTSNYYRVQNPVPGVQYYLRSDTTIILGPLSSNGPPIVFGFSVTADTTLNVFAVNTSACGTLSKINYHSIEILLPSAGELGTIAPVQDSICYGDPVTVTLSNSLPDINYSLVYSSGSTISGIVPGTGGPIQITSSVGLTSDTIIKVYVNHIGSPPCWLYTANMNIAVEQTYASFLPDTIVITGDTISMNSSSSGTGYYWDFGPAGNPATSAAYNPTVVYNTPGDYPVQLIVFGTSCNDTLTKIIHVYDAAPGSTGSLCYGDALPYTLNYPGGNDNYKIFDTHMDENGNTYLTGCYFIMNGPYRTFNLLIAKHDPYGTLLWEKKLTPNTLNYRTTCGTAITTDASGNVYVTGSFYNYNLEIDSITISNPNSTAIQGFVAKLNSSAIAQWIIHIESSAVGGPGMGPSDIKILNSDTLVILQNGGFDQVNFPNGASPVPNPAMGPNRIYILQTTLNGEYISINYATIDNLGALSLNTNGSVLSSQVVWTNPELHISSQGKIIVAGQFNQYAYFGNDTLLSAFPSPIANGYYAVFDNSNGWVKAIKTFEGVYFYNLFSTTLDASDNLYIHQYSTPGTMFQSMAIEGLVLAKFDLTGNLLWYTSSSDIFPGEIIFSDSLIYATGYFNDAQIIGSTAQPFYAVKSSGSYDFIFYAYDTSGNVMWVDAAGTILKKTQGLKLCANSCNQLYLTGYADSSFTYKTNMFISNKNFFDLRFSPGNNCNNIPCPVGMQEQNILSRDVAVIPNPFNSGITITINKQNLKHAEFTIKNILGKTVFSESKNNPVVSLTKTIDLKFLAKGIYLLDVIMDGERTVKKIVKE